MTYPSPQAVVPEAISQLIGRITFQCYACETSAGGEYIVIVGLPLTGTIHDRIEEQSFFTSSSEIDRFFIPFIRVITIIRSLGILSNN
jgi:hypothetical protein